MDIMTGMEGCVFCGIAAGKIPAEIMYQDEEMLVFPDKFPSAPIHLLCVSRVHGEELITVPADKLMRMLVWIRGELKTRGLDKKSYRISINGAGATLVKNHLHIHLLGDVSRERAV